MTLGAPTSLLSGSSSSDLAAYPTASGTAAPIGSRVIMFVVSGKSANLSESPTGVSHGSVGALTKINSLPVPNSNLTLSAWTHVGNGQAQAYTITHTNVMENCCWQVVALTSDVSTPTVRRNAMSAAAGAGTDGATLSAAALSTSCVLGAIGYNSGSTNTPTVGAGFTQIGTRQTQTSPTVQLMTEYDNTSPPTTADWSVPIAAGRSHIAVEVADGTAVPASGPTVEIDGVSGTVSIWDGAQEINVFAAEFA